MTRIATHGLWDRLSRRWLEPATEPPTDLGLAIDAGQPLLPAPRPLLPPAGAWLR